MTKTETEIERGIPGLRKIPLLKWLFMVREKQNTLSNLIVFLTPRVIRSSEDIEATIKEAMREYRSKMEKDWKDIFPEDVLPQPGSMPAPADEPAPAPAPEAAEESAPAEAGDA
jgi:general secretion pathway protein D